MVDARGAPSRHDQGALLMTELFSVSRDRMINPLETKWRISPSDAS
jgi:hypothetical protein